MFNVVWTVDVALGLAFLRMSSSTSGDEMLVRLSRCSVNGSLSTESSFLRFLLLPFTFPSPCSSSPSVSSPSFNGNEVLRNFNIRGFLFAFSRTGGDDGGVEVGWSSVFGLEGRDDDEDGIGLKYFMMEPRLMTWGASDIDDSLIGLVVSEDFAPSSVFASLFSNGTETLASLAISSLGDSVRRRFNGASVRNSGVDEARLPYVCKGFRRGRGGLSMLS